MTALLTAADLVARLRTGGGVHEPAALVIDWRSYFSEVLDSGFDPESGDDASSDAAALCGDELHHVSEYFPDAPPWRDSYLIRPAEPTHSKETPDV